ncbi:unnamed protein product [Phytophthora fragariaefolia]|uniref:Unnamed protein product n=1 Tax=Phytophthora fragariaefolia TaxID=1490495 RepID=A0A9W6Y1K7_9STRA|nr:unnamed protein product [Phytophthora fragariaefolia]
MPNGKGKRFCIVEARVAFVKNGKLHAEWVPESLEYWPSHYTAQDAGIMKISTIIFLIADLKVSVVYFN